MNKIAQLGKKSATRIGTAKASFVPFSPSKQHTPAQHGLSPGMGRPPDGGIQHGHPGLPGGLYGWAPRTTPEHGADPGQFPLRIGRHAAPGCHRGPREHHPGGSVPGLEADPAVLAEGHPPPEEYGHLRLDERHGYRRQSGLRHHRQRRRRDLSWRVYPQHRHPAGHGTDQQVNTVGRHHQRGPPPQTAVAGSPSAGVRPEREGFLQKVIPYCPAYQQTN